MPNRHPSSPITAASTALLFGLAALGATACDADRTAADARRALGTQLGSAPSATHAPLDRQTASADDLTTARRYLEATLRLDPANAGARAALAGLGGPTSDDVDLAAVDVVHMPGPVAARATGGRRAASFTQTAFGEVGAFGADVAAAVSPWATVPTMHLPITRSSPDSVRPITEIVAASQATDSAARDSVARVARRSRARLAAARRRSARDARVTVAARDDSGTVSDADSVRTVAAVAAPKHKRTWPWTRAQRWLVAKGIGGGAGAGVVVGALIGNVPGALLAGSLTGGAVGFKKATKVGPAAPYPSKSDSAAFDADKRAREAAEHEPKLRADTTARVALGRP
ncbi:hypothetical protein tb265_30390 [Gemmatimonadetes bacterium T265]|nr:hypothetical protein tb265_30390 [Gemmatimonadetes bacterium T265]